MIELNSYLLSKMGWVPYSINRGIGHDARMFADDPLVRYFIDMKDINTTYIIKELSEDEKLKSKNLYKFIKMEYNPILVKDGIPKFTVKEFVDNQNLLILVIQNKACNAEYHRYFTINNILHEENRS